MNMEGSNDFSAEVRPNAGLQQTLASLTALLKREQEIRSIQCLVEQIRLLNENEQRLWDWGRRKLLDQAYTGTEGRESMESNEARFEDLHSCFLTAEAQVLLGSKSPESRKLPSLNDEDTRVLMLMVLNLKMELLSKMSQHLHRVGIIHGQNLNVPTPPRGVLDVIQEARQETELMKKKIQSSGLSEDLLHSIFGGMPNMDGPAGGVSGDDPLSALLRALGMEDN